MEKVFNTVTGAIENINEKKYKVTIGDSSGNRLSLKLSRVEFDSLNVFSFIELGFFVSIYKSNHVQDIE